MVRNAVMTNSASQAPLSPQVMAQAGVPLSDALWFARIPGGAKRLQALGTPTGRRILEAVRGFQLKLTASDAMPSPA